MAIAVPLVLGQSGFLAAAVVGIAGLMAAHDLVGVLGHGRGGGGHGLGDAVSYARMAGRASGGAGVAAAAIPANRVTTLADQYGYQ
jgi:hypothetical protein